MFIVHLQLPGPNEKGLMWFLKWQKSFPKAMTVWFGPMNPFLQIYHPDTIKAVLKSTLPKQVSGVLGYTTVLPWLGMKCVILLNLDKIKITVACGGL